MSNVEDAAPATPEAEAEDGASASFGIGGEGGGAVRVGIIDVKQTAGGLAINDISGYFDQRDKKIKQCPPHLYVLFKRGDGRRPSWGFNKSYIEHPKLLLPGLENLAAGRRIATEVVPRSHQAFQFKVAADTSDDAYYEHDVRVVFSVKQPVRFIDKTGLDASSAECAASVGKRFFQDFMSPIIRARLDSLTKMVDTDGIDLLNAHPEIVHRYMFNNDYDVEGALFELVDAHENKRPPKLPPPPQERYDEEWDQFFTDYGVRLERFVSSIDQSEEIAASNLQKANAKAAAERAKIEADVKLYVEQKKGEAAAAGTVAFIRTLQETLFEVFGDSVRDPKGFRYALSALAEFKALNSPEPGQRIYITTGGDTETSELLARVQQLLDSQD